MQTIHIRFTKNHDVMAQVPNKQTRIHEPLLLASYHPGEIVEVEKIDRFAFRDPKKEVIIDYDDKEPTFEIVGSPPPS